jgi:hypothetical protein
MAAINGNGMYALVGIVVPTFAKNIFHIALLITASISAWFLKPWVVTSKGSHLVLKNYLK